MAIDRSSARRALSEYAGLSDAEADRLLNAVLSAAEREALELLAGDAPIPSSLTDYRALRLRYITQSAQRALKPREVEVILRTSPASARAALQRMNATYL